MLKNDLHEKSTRISSFTCEEEPLIFKMSFSVRHVFILFSVSWNADDLDSTLMKFEDGVDLALSRAKAWAKYAKDVATYVEKRAQMGKEDGIGCRYL